MIRFKTITITCIILLLLITASGQNIDYVNSILWTRLHDINVADDLVYCVFQNGLAILDVSNPETPVVISKLYLEGESYLLIILVE